MRAKVAAWYTERLARTRAKEALPPLATFLEVERAVTVLDGDELDTKAAAHAKLVAQEEAAADRE